jgi:hypothetical protein
MKLKELRSIADSLCQMGCSARISTSLERIADLPDAALRIDLLSGSCIHGRVGDLPLPMVEEFRAWLTERLRGAGIANDVLERAILSLRYTTDRVATDRSRILLFELECTSELAVQGRVFRGHASDSLWYERAS